MKNINILILESSLLFILVVTLFRSQFIENRIVILLTAILILVFILLSFFPVKSLHFKNIRFFLLISILIIIQGYMLIKSVGDRRVEQGSVHDGIILTEASYRALIKLQNPYSVNFGDVLNREKYFGDVPLWAVFHYPYSPMMFLVNMPLFYATDKLFGLVDMRITLVVFLFLTALIGALMVQGKILFLIIFLLNPLFIPLLFYGANDIIILFFFFLLLYFLKIRRETLATITLGLATGTKLLISPLVPLYFLYIFLTRKGKTRSPIKQIGIFLLVNLAIYLPFFIWSRHDLMDDLLSPWFGKGVYTHPIAGFLGVGQILNRLGLISSDASFPFFIFVVPFNAIFLVISFKILKKSLNIQTFSIIFVFNLLLILAFSRIVQTYYLAFISQILLFSAFLMTSRNSGLQGK